MVFTLVALKFFLSAQQSTVRKLAVPVLAIVIGLLYPITSWSQQQPMPPIKVEEQANKAKPKKVENTCKSVMVSEDIENRYANIRKNLESSYDKGLPKEIRGELFIVRKSLDGLTNQLFDVDTGNTQEVNLIVQKTIDHLEKMISILPKVNKVAPQVRDQFVVPFTNLSSIKAEHQDCLMEIAVKEASENKDADKDSSGNIYRKLTNELKKLNEDLYTLQTTDVQRYINLRAKLLKGLEAYNKNPESAHTLLAEIPKITNNVHNEIEKMLPGLKLSKKYYSLAQ